MKILYFSGKLDLEKIYEKIKMNELQAFDADKIISEEQIISAYNHALRAFTYKKNITKTLALEIILYVAVKRQIKEAIDFVGVSKNTTNFVIIELKPNAAEGLAEKIQIWNFKNTVEKFKLYNIDSIVMNSTTTPQDLILEKIALHYLEIT